MPGQKFQLFENVRSVITEAQRSIIRNVNSAMVLAYFRIGKMIVEEQQQGSDRAAYAKEIIPRLSVEFGKGYGTSSLEYMRSFYLT